MTPLWTEVLETSMAALDDATLQRIVDRVDVAFALEDPSILSGWKPESESGKKEIYEVAVFLLYTMARTWEATSGFELEDRRVAWRWILRGKYANLFPHSIPMQLLTHAIGAVNDYYQVCAQTHPEIAQILLSNSHLELSRRSSHGAKQMDFRFVLPGWNEVEQWVEREGLQDYVVYVCGSKGKMFLGQPRRNHELVVAYHARGSAMEHARAYAKKFGYKLYPTPVADSRSMDPRLAVEP